MRSSGSADRLALDRGLPTTADDVAALRQARTARRAELVDYLRFLESLGDPPSGALRSRRGPTGPAFELRAEGGA